jgi:translation initiation factor 1A
LRKGNPYQEISRIHSRQQRTYIIRIGVGWITSIDNTKEEGIPVAAVEESQNGAEGGEVIRVRLPKKFNREQFALAELMMGANHIRVRCFDGVTRMGRIKGKIKKRAWIREGDVVIITPWSFQDDKCDISYRYTPPQRDWLRRNKYI